MKSKLVLLELKFRVSSEIIFEKNAVVGNITKRTNSLNDLLSQVLIKINQLKNDMHNDSESSAHDSAYDIKLKNLIGSIAQQMTAIEKTKEIKTAEASKSILGYTKLLQKNPHEILEASEYSKLKQYKDELIKIAGELAAPNAELEQLLLDAEKLLAIQKIKENCDSILINDQLIINRARMAVEIDIKSVINEKMIANTRTAYQSRVQSMLSIKSRFQDQLNKLQKIDSPLKELLNADIQLQMDKVDGAVEIAKTMEIQTISRIYSHAIANALLNYNYWNAPEYTTSVIDRNYKYKLPDEIGILVNTMKSTNIDAWNNPGELLIKLRQASEFIKYNPTNNPKVNNFFEIIANIPDEPTYEALKNFMQNPAYTTSTRKFLANNRLENISAATEDRDDEEEITPEYNAEYIKEQRKFWKDKVATEHAERIKKLNEKKFPPKKLQVNLQQSISQAKPKEKPVASPKSSSIWKKLAVGAYVGLTVAGIVTISVLTFGGATLPLVAIGAIAFFSFAIPTVATAAYLEEIELSEKPPVRQKVIGDKASATIIKSSPDLTAQSQPKPRPEIQNKDEYLTGADLKEISVVAGFNRAKHIFDNKPYKSQNAEYEKSDDYRTLKAIEKIVGSYSDNDKVIENNVNKNIIQRYKELRAEYRESKTKAEAERQAPQNK